MKHKIYLIEETEESDSSWDSYDSHVVIADSEEEARRMCPTADQRKDCFTNPKYSTIKVVGESDEEKDVVLSSFNAG
jgi:hypothetical protein